MEPKMMDPAEKAAEQIQVVYSDANLSPVVFAGDAAELVVRPHEIAAIIRAAYSEHADANAVRSEIFRLAGFESDPDAEIKRLREELEKIAKLPSRTPSKAHAQQIAHKAADIARAALEPQ